MDKLPDEILLIIASFVEIDTIPNLIKTCLIYRNLLDNKFFKDYLKSKLKWELTMGSGVILDLGKEIITKYNTYSSMIIPSRLTPFFNKIKLNILFKEKDANIFIEINKKNETLYGEQSCSAFNSCFKNEIVIQKVNMINYLKIKWFGLKIEDQNRFILSHNLSDEFPLDPVYINKNKKKINYNNNYYFKVSTIGKIDLALEV